MYGKNKNKMSNILNSNGAIHLKFHSRNDNSASFRVTLCACEMKIRSTLYPNPICLTEIQVYGSLFPHVYCGSNVEVNCYISKIFTWQQLTNFNDLRIENFRKYYPNVKF